ncbi:MAG: head-tail connector protein [Bosea sp. (in: a-proteobacteria)]
MSPILIMPPAAEPVTLAEAKLYLRTAGPDEDDLVIALIRAARQLVEATSNRLLVSQTWRLVCEAWPTGGVLRLPLSPVIAIAAARVLATQGPPVAVDAGALRLDQGSDPPLLRVVGLLPAPQRPHGGIEIDLIAGHGAPADVPEPFRQAMLMLVARWSENRGDATGHGDARLPADVLALIAPFRRARL